MRPLGDRVLIKPDQAPQMTASGLHLAEDWKPEQTGTVVAVGQPRHPRRDEALIWAQAIEDADPNAAGLLRTLAHKESEVKPGDYVIFSWQAGQELWINDGEDRLLVMKASDILAVVEGVSA